MAIWGPVLFHSLTGMLLELPVELLIKIAGFARQKDRLNLRLTCTILSNVAVEPAFFSLSLNTSSANNKSIIRELSRYDTANIARHVKYLNVVTDAEPHYGTCQFDAAQFAQAIQPFVFVTGISWTCLLVDNASFLRRIAETLASLPRVSSVKLRIGDIEIPPLPFRDLVQFDATFTGSASGVRFMQSNFPTICANSPRLETLVLSNPMASLLPFNGDEDTLLRPLCQTGIRELYLRQCSARFVNSPAVLRSLSSVSLHDMPHMDELWMLLRREEIHLSKMDVDRISGDLIDYVLAFEGLEMLKLRCEDDNPSDDALGRRFWDEVVGKHRETLRDLEVVPRFEGVWCFEANLENEIFRCAKLETLRVSLKFRSLSKDLMYLMNSVQPSLERLVIDCPPLCSPRHGPPPLGKSKEAARKWMEMIISAVDFHRIDESRRLFTVQIALWR